MPGSGKIVKTFGGSKVLTRSPCGKGQSRPLGETGTQEQYKRPNRLATNHEKANS